MSFFLKPSFKNSKWPTHHPFTYFSTQIGQKLTRFASSRLDYLPKIFYTLLQGSFLVALIGLNWDFLSTENDGIVVLTLTAVLAVGTFTFYFLTGCTDPGFVRAQIFENHFETTEFAETE